MHLSFCVCISHPRHDVGLGSPDPLGPPTPPRIKAVKKDPDADANSEEDADVAEEENDTYVKADVHLRETLRVVSDAIALGANQDLWASSRPPLTAAGGG